MIDIIVDTLLDSIKILPFLFIAFLIIEYIEHKFSDKSIETVRKAGKFGPLFGSLLGLIPQCGFSTLATNLYVTRIVSLGTLIGIYLATSDEMLPIMISHQVELSLIVKVLAIKFIAGIVVGFIIDFLFRKNKDNSIHEICEDENCHCEEEGILKSSLIHTFKTLLFVLVITFILNIMFYYISDKVIEKIFLKESILAPVLSSVVGLIPNCGASIMVTELYLNNTISFGALMSGVLANSGVSLLVLFKSNKNIKENISILGILYIVSVIIGILIEIIV